MTQSINEIKWPWFKKPDSTKIEPMVNNSNLNSVESLLKRMSNHTNPLVKAYAEKVLANLPTLSQRQTTTQLRRMISDNQQKLLQLSQNIPTEQLVTLAAIAKSSTKDNIDQTIQFLDKSSTSTDINARYAQAVSSMRRLTELNKTKILPSRKIVNTTLDDLKKGRYNKEYAILSANRIMSLAQKGYNVAYLHNQWLAYAKLSDKKGGPLEEDLNY
jgi:hypothetical protein